MSSTDIARRELLRVGAASALVGSASGWFGPMAQKARSQATAAGARPKSCILLWMAGGPSQFETFSPKPGVEMGNAFSTIATNVPGIHFNELLPRMAARMDRLAVLRSMSYNNGTANHGPSWKLMHLGGRSGPATELPPIGSIVSAELGRPDAALPNFVTVLGKGRLGAGVGILGPGYLGPRHRPMIVSARSERSNRGSFFEPAVAAPVLDARFELLREQNADFARQTSAPPVVGHQNTYEQAHRLIRSNQLRAFAIDSEPVSIRERYGCGHPQYDLAEGCLVARRLVEIGVPFVEVVMGDWDMHSRVFSGSRLLNPIVDNAFSALLDDLADRGLLESTLVIWMGEFGRTPRLEGGGSGEPGRNHFGRAWTTVMAGAGIRAGQVVGSTSPDGAEVTDRPISPPQFMATVCRAIGVDHTREYNARTGERVPDDGRGQSVNGSRPVPIVENGAAPVAELF